MCVAIYKPKGIKAPTIETLKDCWDANPDGAGLAWRCDGKFPIHIEKGFMKWDEFESYWKSAGVGDYDGDLFIHFRITTHGGTSDGNTHPFPICDNDDHLKTLSLNSKYALMHNGVLPIQPDNVKISDTMMLAKLIARGGFEKEITHTLNLLEGLIGTNKVAVMTTDDVHLVGNWQDVDGVKYSNLYWQFTYNPTGTSYGFRDCLTFDNRQKHTSSVHPYYVDDDDELYEVCATAEEIEMLRDGTCPLCAADGCSVVEYSDGYGCFECGTLFKINVG